MVEHLRAARHLYCKITDHWTEDYGVWAYFDDQGVADAHPLYPGHAETVPHAICLAALAAVESEAPHD